MYLHTLDNYSQHIIDLVDRDRLDRLDSTLINNKIKEHQEAIKELQDLKKAKPINEDKIHELLAYHAPNYKQNAVRRSESQRTDFIKRAILPDLKKLGSKQTAQEIDELLLNWPDDE